MYLPPNLTANTIADTICLIIAVVLILASAASLILSFAIWRPFNVIANAIPFVIDLILFHAVYDACSSIARQQGAVSIFGRFVTQMDIRIEILFAVALLLIALLRMWSMARMVTDSVTIFSVGDALDDLPAGVLFASRAGQVVQANAVMEDLNYELTEDALLDSERFWKKIKQIGEELATEVEQPNDSEETRLIRMPDDRQWIFRRSLHASSVMDFQQILATDVTEEQRLNDEYRSHVQQLAGVNRRLRRYNDMVDETVRREELLEAKKRVHDNMGTVLLSTRMFLENEDAPVTAEHLMQQWRADLTLLREEAREEQADPLQRYRDVAAYLGLDLKIEGSVPKDPEVAELLAIGLQECLTNAVSHGRANRLLVRIRQSGEENESGAAPAFVGTVITYENDGEVPTRPIREGGGLAILRQRAEQMGAIMDYPEHDRFCLRLRIQR